MESANPKTPMVAVTVRVAGRVSVEGKDWKLFK